MKVLTAVSVLLAAVLAAGCASQQSTSAEVNSAETLAARNEALTRVNQQLSADLKGDQVKITQLQKQLKLTMVNEVLFPEGGWTLSQKGEATLTKIAPTLASLKGQQVVIEGFTDNVPIGPAMRQRFPSNWELSSARATDVLRYLVAKGVPSKMMSAQGFGDSRPIATNDTPAGRAQNRRVEIVITAASRP